MNIAEQVKLDICELVKVGGVSASKAKQALAYVDAHVSEVEEYYTTGGMRIADISDLVILIC